MNVFHDCVIDEPSKQLEYLLPNYCLSTFKTCTTRQMPRIKTADVYLVNSTQIVFQRKKMY